MVLILAILGTPTFQLKRRDSLDQNYVLGDSYWWENVPAARAIQAKSIDPVNVRLIDIPGSVMFEVNYFNAV